MEEKHQNSDMSELKKMPEIKKKRKKKNHILNSLFLPRSFSIAFCPCDTVLAMARRLESVSWFGEQPLARSLFEKIKDNNIFLETKQLLELREC